MNKAASPSELCIDLLDLFGRSRARTAEIAESGGLSAAQLATLRAIDQGKITMGQVAQALYCDASNVTGITDRLVVLRLITRQESVQDRRVKTLQLTAAGKELLTKSLAQLQADFGFEQLSADERTALHGIIPKLLAGQELK